MTEENVAIFTKQNPCTKVEIHNCFQGRRGYVKVEEADVFAVIGRNVPRVLVREGRATRTKTAKGDFYELTPEGKSWLRKGLRRYLRNNPDKVPLAERLPKDFLDDISG